ncbi:metallophosphoesterase [Paraburkholderia silvatlantica]|uniref:Serine/threonine protein phosphatase 1 n=1 Tax=Paraburkholderia silvatlantica TaxID=321895 RepID=A0ABR6FV78_9BURK|nr:metallophosphoesterase [Paraburkholderia silvatlantica]MBB2931340.1 serine/threonine protein phosphatase 1 [Paraburkholderia silvatlantica]PVY28226.1 serine/threonine protein phosphatase 1 [Paraburkholderia silvatlantica]PXW34911.1 serine/threonine protein phosphatase 1 [Paraburkholderia silvatlantica]TDQ98818.1 serine/threonine protein phosphatase 1 [Paraburkholderia silvatlantica]
MTHTPDALVQHHAANLAGRDFVVGDLHGCVEALRYLLREVEFDTARDRLFSVGDLVDRGEREQCEQALALLDKPWFYAVLGNHEDALCAVAEGRMPRNRWYGIGGGWAQSVPDAELVHYAQRLRQLPLARVVGEGEKRFNVIHAEFFGDDAALDSGQFDSDVRERLLWGRDLVLGTGDPTRHGLSLTFCGHTPVREVRQIGAQVFIDTGAFITEGRLTMVEALTSRIWSVPQVEALAHGAAAIVLP